MRSRASKEKPGTPPQTSSLDDVHAGRERRFQASLRDASLPHVCKPWAEAHGHRHLVAPRPWASRSEAATTALNAGSMCPALVSASFIAWGVWAFSLRAVSSPRPQVVSRCQAHVGPGRVGPLCDQFRCGLAGGGEVQFVLDRGRIGVGHPH